MAANSLKPFKDSATDLYAATSKNHLVGQKKQLEKKPHLRINLAATVASHSRCPNKRRAEQGLPSSHHLAEDSREGAAIRSSEPHLPFLLAVQNKDAVAAAQQLSDALGRRSSVIPSTGGTLFAPIAAPPHSEEIAAINRYSSTLAQPTPAWGGAEARSLQQQAPFVPPRRRPRGSHVCKLVAKGRTALVREEGQKASSSAHQDREMDNFWLPVGGSGGAINTLVLGVENLWLSPEFIKRRRRYKGVNPQPLEGGQLVKSVLATYVSAKGHDINLMRIPASREEEALQAIGEHLECRKKGKWAAVISVKLTCKLVKVFNARQYTEAPSSPVPPCHALSKNCLSVRIALAPTSIGLSIALSLEAPLRHLASAKGQSCNLVQSLGVLAKREALQAIGERALRVNERCKSMNNYSSSARNASFRSMFNARHYT
ncbi:hypothetical protein MUK42_22221 [Musa troglodytarum]|uniref:Uncharacterized protein n=1 Tax=Musa troglodytarum TaxID=320322 RepID=A0A9E7GZL4_9LILI|nr:hypothetical protein MUK42_22221 [Musa troglodytarum]